MSNLWYNCFSALCSVIRFDDLLGLFNSLCAPISCFFFFFAFSAAAPEKHTHRNDWGQLLSRAFGAMIIHFCYLLLSSHIWLTYICYCFLLVLFFRYLVANFIRLKRAKHKKKLISKWWLTTLRFGKLGNVAKYGEISHVLEQFRATLQNNSNWF